jgi:hypothetical protein
VVVFFAREPREVEDNDEMNLALVRPAVLEKPLQLRTVGGLCALPSSVDSSKPAISRHFKARHF